jgi:predicted phosphodiesterase
MGNILLKVTMKKIGVFTDTHGNLPALKLMLDYFQTQGCEEILHLGDIIDIGPHSKQCFDLITKTPNLTCILGNHDRDFVLNNPFVRPFSHVPTEHKMHVFATMTEDDRQITKRFPLYVTRNIGGQKLLFCHYPFDWNASNTYFDDFPFLPIQNTQTPQNFDLLLKDFQNYDAIFFGHKHEYADVVGERVYVNVGSLGCHPNAWAQGIVIEYDDNSWTYSRVRIPYDMQQVHQDMQQIACGEQLYNFYFLRIKP